MYSAERQEGILQRARATGRVRVATLADDLGMANETAVATRFGRLTDTKHRMAACVLERIPVGAPDGKGAKVSRAHAVAVPGLGVPAPEYRRDVGVSVETSPSLTYSLGL